MASGKRSIRIYLTREQSELMEQADPETNWARIFRRAAMAELEHQGVLPPAPKGSRAA